MLQEQELSQLKPQLPKQDLLPSSQEMSGATVDTEETEGDEGWSRSLEGSMKALVPFVQRNIERMLNDGLVFAGKTFGLETKEAEAAGGFRFVAKEVSKKLLQKRAVKRLFKNYKGGLLTRDEFIRFAKEDIHSNEMLEYLGGKAEFEVLPFSLTPKPTFQLENLKSLLKLEPKIRIKDIFKKLPRLRPLLKDHGWNGEKLTLQQVEKHLGKDKTLFAGRWGKWEPLGEETWLKGQADDVLVVMPTRPSEELLKRLRLNVLEGSHPPGYGWIRFKDVGDTRVVHEIQSDIEHGILGSIKNKKESIEALKGGLERGEAHFGMAEELIRGTRPEIERLKLLFNENIKWKEDALSSIIIDARKKGLKNIFIPEMKSLPRGATKEQKLFDSYYKNTMQKVGGFQKGSIKGEKDPFEVIKLNDSFNGAVFALRMLKLVHLGKFKAPIADAFIQIVNRIVDTRKNSGMFTNYRDVFKLLAKTKYKQIIKQLLLLGRTRESISGYIRPVKYALPLGFGLFMKREQEQ